MYCIKREAEKIAMPELFDIIAGTETGAIIAGSLVIPGKNEKGEDDFVAMYAHNSKMFFQEHSKNLFVSQELSFWWNILISVVFAFLLAALVYACLSKQFKINPRKVKHISEVQLMIHFQKEIASGEMHHQDKEKLDKNLAKLEELQAQHKQGVHHDPEMLQILIKTHVAMKRAGSVITNLQNVHDQHMNDLHAVDKKIDGIQKKHTQYRIIKFGGSFVMGIISVFLA